MGKMLGAGSAAELARVLRGNGVFEDAPLSLLRRDVVALQEDFLDYVTAHRWASALTATGTIAVGDAAGGVLVLTTKAEDDAYCQVATTNEIFKVAVNAPIWFEARVKVTEANTNAANVFVGLSDTLTMPQAAGAGLPASFDGMGFYKVDGGTKWQFRTSKTTAQVLTADVATVTSGTWLNLGFKVVPNANGTTATVTAFVDGIEVAKHTLSVVSMGEMRAVFGLKAGSANAEVLSVDWIDAYQVRA